MINNANEIIDNSDIVQIISDFVELKQAGVNWKGNCPFHDEKTASFVVNPVKGIYKCFGCGAAGNVAKFLMEHEKMSFPESLKYLAQKNNTKIDETKLSEKAEKDIEQKRKKIEALHIIYKEAARFYHVNLKLALRKEIQKGWKKRIDQMPDAEILSLYKIGKAPNEWKSLYNHLRKKGFKHDFICASDLVIEKGDKLYDRFRNRIMFPIFDSSGNVIAFSGRTLGNDNAKYINSSNFLLYNKDLAIYGLFQAQGPIRKRDCVFIVEGSFDVLKLALIGSRNVVAMNGTALSDSQIKILSKYTENFILMYDGDNAGEGAALKNGVKIMKETGIVPSICELPAGHDPDSFF